MYLHILGSGAGGSPGSKRWRAANLLETENYLVLVDCGVGCHYRLSDRRLLTEIDYVFITHSHMDHYLGLPEALFQAHIEGRRKPLYIYAPRVVEETTRLVATHLYKSPNFEIVFHKLSPGPLLELPHLKAQAATACHNTADEAYAFRFSVDGIDVLFSGDTAPRCDTIRQLGTGVDVAVFEATCNEQNGEICRRYGHVTTLEAVQEADAMEASELVLTHIDERLNPTIYQDVRGIGRDVIVAEDNMVIRL